MGSSHILDQLDTCFDDTHAIANAGLLLAATLASGWASSRPPMRYRPGRAGWRAPARPQPAGLVHPLIAGADGIDAAALLRCGATSRVLGHRVMAPSTLGTFVRAFTSGMSASSTASPSSYSRGRGRPARAPVMADDDRPGLHHLPAARPPPAGRRLRLHPHTLGDHPLLATGADRGAVLHARQRTGRANTARGTARLVEELAARVRRAGASGELTLRPDSGFGRPRPCAASCWPYPAG
jgi:hypothetical protein